MFDKGQKQSSTLSCDSSYDFTFSLVIFFLYLCLCYLAEFAFILTISDEKKSECKLKKLEYSEVCQCPFFQSFVVLF